MKEALSLYETLVLTTATRRNIPEDTILHSRRRENLKSYTFEFVSSTEEPVTSSELEAGVHGRTYHHSTSELGAVGAAQTFSYGHGARAHGGCSVTALQIVKVN
jgi:hypothetical protein